MSSQGTKSKSQARSGGPRTSRGKATSSQNSSKHKIFVHHLLPEEADEANLLLEEIREELRLNGPLELSVGRDLVQNEFESQRVEKFAAQESLKAQKLADLSLEQLPLIRSPIPPEKKDEPGYCTRLRPAWCVMFLNNFKKTIKNKGPRREFDLEYLRWIYGDEMTALGEGIWLLYTIFTQMSAQTGDEAKPEAETPDYQQLLFDQIDREIEAQKTLAAVENVQTFFKECLSNVVLPSDELWDRIEKYRTASARKRNRLLEQLQTIRHLKRQK